MHIIAYQPQGKVVWMSRNRYLENELAKFFRSSISIKSIDAVAVLKHVYDTSIFIINYFNKFINTPIGFNIPTSYPGILYQLR